MTTVGRTRIEPTLIAPSMTVAPEPDESVLDEIQRVLAVAAWWHAALGPVK
jgi:hypothetical protein